MTERKDGTQGRKARTERKYGTNASTECKDGTQLRNASTKPKYRMQKYLAYYIPILQALPSFDKGVSYFEG